MNEQQENLAGMLDNDITVLEAMTQILEEQKAALAEIDRLEAETEEEINAEFEKIFEAIDLALAKEAGEISDENSVESICF